MRVLPNGYCFCGCGQETTRGSLFAAGHDKIAESAVILAEYGGVAEFLVAHGYGPRGRNPQETLAALKDGQPAPAPLGATRAGALRLLRTVVANELEGVPEVWVGSYEDARRRAQDDGGKIVRHAIDYLVNGGFADVRWDFPDRKLEKGGFYIAPTARGRIAVDEWIIHAEGQGDEPGCKAEGFTIKDAPGPVTCPKCRKIITTFQVT